MRVLHVHSGNLFGGVERMLEALAPGSAGSAPIVSSFALCFSGQVAETLRAARGDVHLLGSVRARRLDEVRSARKHLRQLIDDTKPDVVLVHSAWSQAIFGPTILKSGVPLVRWLHAPQPGPAWLEVWASRSVPALVLCNSRYTMENAGKRFGRVPLVVQHPPVAVQAAAPGAREAVRAAIGSPHDAIVVLMAARLESGKGHRQLLESLAAVRSHRWQAWIAGGIQKPAERSYFDELRRLALTLGIAAQVRFLGQRSDIADLFCAADIYCQPNTGADSFGLSFVEALASGLPVVTTRLGGAPEIVDETCGVLVAPGTSGPVATALERLIEDEPSRRAMSAAARVRGGEFCDVTRSVGTLAAHLACVAPPTLALT